MNINRDYYYKLVDFLKSLYNVYSPAFSRLIEYYYDRTLDQSIYIEKLNCIYIPIPKVGTKSVKQVFANYLLEENDDKRLNRKH